MFKRSPSNTRCASADQPSVLIVGSGLGGIAAAIALKRDGVQRITLLERASDVGGTWNANRYPGIAVDTSVLNYSFSFDANPGWSRLFAPGSELHSYTKRLCVRYGILEHIRFDTTVEEMRFDTALNQWEVETASGETLVADVVISATGALSTPSLPKIPGLENFKGTLIHSAQWDEKFDARGKVIAQVGSGATAAQLVPEIAKTAAEVFVYQRSAPWVLPRNDRAIGRLESTVNRAVPWSLKLRRWKQFWANDIIARGFEKQDRTMRKQTHAALAFLERSIADPELRAMATPDYEIGCKRRVMSDDWYPALQRQNVSLIPHAVTAVKEHSVVDAAGEEREVDALIFSTGFDVGRMMTMKVFGCHGQELHDVWSSGARSHLGLAVSGFPNLFFMYGPNTGIGSGSTTFMLECQARYIAQAVQYLAAHPHTALEVLKVIQNRSYRRVQDRLATSVFGSGCVGWYQSAHGTIDTLWPGLNSEYWLRTRRFDRRDYLTLARPQHTKEVSR
ncbi:flavin-containing monooxygenase [Rhodococcus wratislaviensis]|uniref:flavin-containing monooxygenase n=1 Tax=Rhodococcus wratislaviensis TaxID=44752 RepID=UPI003661A956